MATICTAAHKICLFGNLHSYAQELLLDLCPVITSGLDQGLYTVPRVEPRSVACKVYECFTSNTIFLALSFFLSSFQNSQGYIVCYKGVILYVFLFK